MKHSMLSILLAGVVFLIAAPAYAVRFEINAEQSYVQAYIPSWKNLGPSSNAFSFIDSEGKLVEVNTVGPDNWMLKFDFVNFALSGYFDVQTERSPLNQVTSHFSITGGEFSAAAPIEAGFSIKNLLTYYPVSGLLQSMSGPCAMDAFYFDSTSTTSCSGFTNGAADSLSGTFDGTSLLADYFSGGILPPTTIITAVNEPDLPSIPAIFGYRLIANQVPEPATLWLFAAAVPLLLAGRVKRAK